LGPQVRETDGCREQRQLRMNKVIIKAMGLTAGLVVALGQSVAAKEITIFDKMGTPPNDNGPDFSGSPGYGGAPWIGGKNLGIAREDNEVEGGNVIGQMWDLEAMVFKGGKLYIIGGYDFKNGQAGETPGDVFLAQGKTFTKYGDAFGATLPIHGLAEPATYTLANSYFGYNFAIKYSVNAAQNGGTFDVYSLTGSSIVNSALWRENDGADAWRYVSGGTKTSSGSLFYQHNITDAAVAAEFDGLALKGGTHNVLGIDMSWYLGSNDWFAHYTYRCGNDSIMGQMVPDNGVTLSLLGMGLGGLAFMGRRLRRA